MGARSRAVPARTSAPHTLFVAWGFAPHQGPGVYRPLATVNELARRGHRVTVLTADLYTFDVLIGGDNSLLDDVDPSVRVIRVPMAPDARDPVLNRWPGSRISNPTGWGQLTVSAQVQAFPEYVYATWQPRIEAVACRLHEQDPIDLVIATGNPYVDFTVPIRLYDEFGIPFVLDDRDSWLLNVYTGELNDDADRIETWLDLALTHALRMWFVNPPLAEWHRQRFPEHADKIRVVENGWDPRFLDVEDIERARVADDGFVLSYVGTINSSLPLRLLADGWRDARRRSSRLAASEFRMIGQIGHDGTVRADVAELMAEFAPDRLVFTGRQSKKLIGQAYAGSDVLVFAKEGASLATSGKVYEYVATGLPIVSAIDPDHDARRILNGYPRWHDALALTPRAIADAMVAALDDVTSGSDRRTAALTHGGRFRRDVILDGALDDVDRALAG